MPTGARPTTRATDLLTGLARDHRRFASRLRTLADGAGAPTRMRGLLVDLLAHSSSERLLLHPIVVGRLEDGTTLATQRRAAQARLADAVAQVAVIPPRSPRRRAVVEDLIDAVAADADHEETHLHPRLAEVLDPVVQRRLARQHAALIVRLPTQIRVAAVDLTAPATTLVRDVLAVAGELLLDLEVDDVIDLSAHKAASRDGGGEIVDLSAGDVRPPALPAS